MRVRKRVTRRQPYASFAFESHTERRATVPKDDEGDAVVIKVPAILVLIILAFLAGYVVGN